MTTGPRRPRWERWPGWGRGWARGAAAAGLAVLALSACATVPDNGSVQAGSVAVTAGGQGQDYLQLIPAPPRPGWTPVQIVSGFLAACASFADNHAVARQYLDPGVRSSWNPGWAVTVVGATPKLGRAVLTRQAGPYNQMEEVKATGEKLATLTATGQYVGTQGSSTYPYPFHLYQIGGQWRIENPPRQLLLTEPDFKRVYAPRNLYFLGPSRALVPDPVFVPLQATYVDLANKLVTALLSEPQGWLGSAVSTAFPAGTVSLRPVTVAGGTATIDLGGSAAGASGDVIRQMTSQLVWTLAGPAYGQSVIQSVNLEINGRLRKSASLPGGQGASPGLSVPAAGAGTPLYAVDGNGRVQELTGKQPSSRPVPGEAGEGTVRLATIAVSPGGQYVAGLTRSRRAVYYGALRPNARLSEWTPGSATFTSLSWDASGDLWVAASDGVWMLRPRGTPVPLAGLPPGVTVSQLRIAPDGVRVAMIASGPDWGGPRLLLAAVQHVPGGDVLLGQTVVIGDDVPQPARLTWYGADNLIVLSRPQTGPQLREVPVNGGSSVPLVTAPETQSISAAGPDNRLAAELAGGQLALTSTVNGTWVVNRAAGLSPTYPG